MEENTLKRIKKYIDYKGVTVSFLEKEVGMSNGSFASQLKNNKTIGVDKLENILKKYPDINPEWLLTGNGTMLKESNTSQNQKLIPVFDDVATIGGVNIVADSEPAYLYNAQEYINPGDWFPEASAAIRHYEESMIEYPPGSKLALIEKFNLMDIVWGEHYVVEWDNGDYNRVTKQLLPCKEDETSIMAYSTNQETWMDGTPRFPPFKIKKKQIKKLFLVLGCVIKRKSGAMVFNTNKRKV